MGRAVSRRLAWIALFFAGESLVFALFCYGGWLELNENKIRGDRRAVLGDAWQTYCGIWSVCAIVGACGLLAAGILWWRSTAPSKARCRRKPPANWDPDLDA